jgi:hypothetical protein
MASVILLVFLTLLILSLKILVLPSITIVEGFLTLEIVAEGTKASTHKLTMRQTIKAKKFLILFIFLLAAQILIFKD